MKRGWYKRIDDPKCIWYVNEYKEMLYGFEIYTEKWCDFRKDPLTYEETYWEEASDNEVCFYIEKEAIKRNIYNVPFLSIEHNKPRERRVFSNTMYKGPEHCNVSSFWTKYGEIFSQGDWGIPMKDRIVFEEDVFYLPETIKELEMLFKEAKKQGKLAYFKFDWYKKDFLGSKRKIRYYNVSKSKHASKQYVKNREYKTKTVKELFNLNKESNDKKRSTNKEHSRVTGRSISFPSRAGQVTSSGRLVGNKTSFRIRKSKTNSTKVSFNVISS